MKKRILVSLVMVISLLVWGGGISYAKVTGVCSNCHTMHNSQNGADLQASEYDHLLVGDCVGCHSHVSAITYDIGTGASKSTVPVVYTTSSAPATYLAGGNFYWVADDGNDDDAKGHNVYGIAGQDIAITAAEGAPGDAYGCGTGSCHSTLATATGTHVGGTVPGGCQGCHLDVQHHTDDGSYNEFNAKYVGAAPWYRFLAGHASGPVMNFGVEGIEHSGWGPSNGTVGGINHNEYKGLSGEVAIMAFSSSGSGTMTGFCAGCHGNFHSTQLSSGGEWIRHPSDFSIPNSGEYASMNTLYNPEIPVARTDADMTALNGKPGTVITKGTDMVMCLSCHRPHGSPYDDMLRWKYADMVAGDNTKSGGCFACHTTKND